MRFRNGEPEAPLKPVGKSDRTGTEITFLPSKETFTKTEFDFARLEHRLRELAFLNSGVNLILTDARSAEPKSITLHYDGGLVAFVEWMDQSKVAVHPVIMVRKEENGITVECAMQWNDSYHENMLCFTNNIPQKDGGTHLAEQVIARHSPVPSMPTPKAAAWRKKKKSPCPARICAKA